MECGLDGKVFKSEEYYEWHLWTNHADLAPNQVCLSDFCDILPCPKKQRKDSLLKRSMQIQRDGKEEIRANLNDEHRGLLDVYTPYDLKRLESRCSKLILDCIDWSHAFKMDPTELYDVLYSLYCAKLTEDGHPKNYEDQLRAFIDEGKAEA